MTLPSPSIVEREIINVNRHDTGYPKIPEINQFTTFDY